MADAISWVQTNWMLVAGTASAIVAGSSAVVAAIAPFTKTDKDDKVASWLAKLHKFLSKVALNPTKDRALPSK
jgi:hypothetical protein